MPSSDACIVVLAGGFNEERNLSLEGGKGVFEALSKKHNNVKLVTWSEVESLPKLLQDADVCFNCLHGSKGEDGTIAGLLEVLNIPYTFSGVFGSACGSDKAKTKDFLRGKTDVQIVPGEIIRTADWKQKGLDARECCPIPLPVMVKDPSQGSSKGVWLCKSEEEFEKAVYQVKAPEALVEKFIVGVDIVVCLLEDGEAADGITSWPVMEFETELEWQDNASKNALWGWEGGANAAPKVLKHCPPKFLDPEIQKRAVVMAKAIYGHLRARSALNVEFRVSGEDIYFIEVSVIPALTSTSVHAACAKAGGVKYEDLVERMLKTASLDIGRTPLAKL